MPADSAQGITYWDASALLSVVVEDAHSREARRWLTRRHVHLVSTLAFAEVMAVLERIARTVPDGTLAAARARRVFLAGPWRWINAQPERATIEACSTRVALRGADLWHLALYRTLRETLPELDLMTFDRDLGAAARGQSESSVDENR